MGDNWNEEDYIRYLRYLKDSHDIFPDFKLNWYQKLWIDVQCWWILHVKKLGGEK